MISRVEERLPGGTVELAGEVVGISRYFKRRGQKRYVYRTFAGQKPYCLIEKSPSSPQDEWMQKPQPSQLPLSVQKPPRANLVSDGGFGMMEVLIAMALIAGAYMGVVESYQRVRLQYGQIEAQRIQLNQAQDEHERGMP
jgi:hypothetical protein